MKTATAARPEFPWFFKRLKNAEAYFFGNSRVNM